MWTSSLAPLGLEIMAESILAMIRLASVENVTAPSVPRMTRWMMNETPHDGKATRAALRRRRFLRASGVSGTVGASGWAGALAAPRLKKPPSDKPPFLAFAFVPLPFLDFPFFPALLAGPSATVSLPSGSSGVASAVVWLRVTVAAGGAIGGGVSIVAGVGGIDGKVV